MLDHMKEARMRGVNPIANEPEYKSLLLKLAAAEEKLIALQVDITALSVYSDDVIAEQVRAWANEYETQE